MSSFDIKRIPAVKTNLAGQADYVDWRYEVETMLEFYDMTDMVTGEEQIPDEYVTETTEADPSTSTVATETIKKNKEHTNWKKKNSWTAAFLIHNIERDVIRSMTKSKIASEIWKSLEDMFDRKTTSTLHSLVGNLMTLRYTPDTTIKEHVTLFANQWNLLLDRTGQFAKDKEGFEYHMHQIAKDAKSKAAFLLLSIKHESMENVVDNLQTKEDLTYEDAYQKLTDLSTRREQTREAEVLVAARPIQNSEKHCLYCKDRQQPYLGHLARECRKKKAARNARKASNPQANIGVADMNATCFMTYTSFLDPCWIDTEYPQIGEEVHDLNYQWTEDTPMVESALTNGTSNATEWIFDTGATEHMAGTNVESIKPVRATVNVAGGKQLAASGIGQGKIVTPGRVIPVKNVLLVPELGTTGLISWQKLAAQGFHMSGKGKNIQIGLNNEILATAELCPTRGLYFLGRSSSTAMIARVEGFHVWHARLGHMPASLLTKLRTMVQDPQSIPVSGVSEDCVDCKMGKSVKLPHHKSTTRTTEILELVHTDLSGKFTTEARGGFRYYITFIDDYSRYAHLYLLKTKNGALQAFKTFKASVEKQTEKRVKKLRSDGGGEYVNREFKEYLEKEGIDHQLSPPYSHQSNGVAERYNRTIFEIARTGFISSALPKNLWGEAMASAVYTKNRIPHSSLTTTPFEAFSNKKPLIGNLRAFGEKGYAHIAVESRPAGSKLQPRAREVRVVGYGSGVGIYRVYDAERKQVFMTRDIRFGSPSVGEDLEKDSDTDSDISIEESETDSDSEEDFEYEPKGEKGKEEEESPPGKTEGYQLSEGDGSYDEEINRLLDEVNEPPPKELDSDNESVHPGTFPESPKLTPVHHDRGRSPPPAPKKPTRKSERSRSRPDRLGFANVAIVEPRTYNQATTGEEADEWQKAMEEEYQAMIENEVWEVVPRPEHKKVVGSRWHYVHKLGPEGEVIRHKARFVAKGFSQVQGIDYQETFSPVFRYESFRFLIALVATLPHKNWKTSQRDVKNAFLNGELKEEVLLEQPKGFEKGQNSVLRLKKTLYGLKQSPREWHSVLSSALAEVGVRKTNFDPSIFINQEKTVVIAAFVDDLATIFSDSKTEQVIFSSLSKHFRMTGGEPINWMVGINIQFEKKQIHLSQSAYLQKVLERFGMEESRPVSTPFENHSISKNTGEAVDTTQYQAVIGSLMYAALGTRPDIAYAVTHLSQFSSNPGPDHWIAVKRIMRYIKGTISVGLTYPRSENNKVHITAYADASYASNVTDRRSFSGQCVLVNNCLVSWKTKKQRSVAVSTTEAEYMALSEASRQLVWLKQAVQDLGLQGTYTLKGDNTGSISLTENPVFHSRSKHIDVHYHFVREKLMAKDFELNWTPTGENCADLFTKGLERIKHQMFTLKLHCVSPGEVLKEEGSDESNED